MHIVFVIVNWGEKQERKENFKFSAHQIKKLISFLEKNDIQCSLHLYCFGKENLLKDSTHINLEALNYHRSFKINYAIKDILNKKIQPDIFCCLDSDIFILEQDYKNFLNYINNTNFKNTYLTAKWYDSSHREDFNFDKYTYINNIRIETMRASDASGFFLVDFKVLKSIGGYDERFTVWGGEDNDLCIRLHKMNIQKQWMDFFFIHLKHERLNEITILETEYKDLYLNQVKIAQNDKSIVRPTLINDYYVQDKI
jgi:predicted glycosyltransferase involved in capsule biosynthesis